MMESLNTLMLAGLGALSITRQRAEEIFDQYVRRGQSEKADREGFVKDLMDSADKAREDLTQTIDKRIHQAVEKLNLATRDDLARLEAKLDALLKQPK